MINIIYPILGFCWLMLCGNGKHQVDYKRITRIERRQLNDLIRSGVCVTIWTRLNADSWNDSYMHNFLWWMKHGLLKSISRQCTGWSPCPLLAQLNMILRIEGRSSEQNGKLIEKLEKLDKNIFWYINPGFKTPKIIEDWMVDIVGISNCSWVSYVYIDADDVFLDGFFQYITTEITKLVIKRRDWRGAIFLPLRLPNLVVGNNICSSEDFEGYSPRHTFWCGFSSGQGLVIKRDIWDDLNYKVLPHFMNLGFIRVARNFVMRSTGFKDYASKSCDKPYNILGYSNYIDKGIFVREEQEAKATGLFLIDVTRNWRTSGILVHTPFSGHFPWAHYNKLPTCDKNLREKILGSFPTDIGWLLKAAEKIHISMEDVCQNNQYMLPGVRNRSRCSELLPTISEKV